MPIKPEHKMTVAQVRRELEPQGFKFREKFDFLPWQHIIVFREAGRSRRRQKSPKQPLELKVRHTP